MFLSLPRTRARVKAFDAAQASAVEQLQSPEVLFTLGSYADKLNETVQQAALLIVKGSVTRIPRSLQEHTGPFVVMTDGSEVITSMEPVFRQLAAQRSLNLNPKLPIGDSHGLFLSRSQAGMLACEEQFSAQMRRVVCAGPIFLHMGNRDASSNAVGAVHEIDHFRFIQTDGLAEAQGAGFSRSTWMEKRAYGTSYAMLAAQARIVPLATDDLADSLKEGVLPTDVAMELKTRIVDTYDKDRLAGSTHFAYIAAELSNNQDMHARPNLDETEFLIAGGLVNRS